MGDDSVGARIQRGRRRAGLNKNQLAREIGTSWQHVDNWESARVQPTLASIRGLARVLDVTSDFLLGLGEQPSGGAPSSLDRFLTSEAPADLSPAEEHWLRNAPVDHGAMDVEDNANLLREARALSNRPAKRKPAARSGTRAKVDRREIEARAAKRKDES